MIGSNQEADRLPQRILVILSARNFSKVYIYIYSNEYCTVDHFEVLCFAHGQANSSKPGYRGVHLCPLFSLQLRRLMRNSKIGQPKHFVINMLQFRNEANFPFLHLSASRTITVKLKIITQNQKTTWCNNKRNYNRKSPVTIAWKSIRYHNRMTVDPNSPHKST